MKKEIYYNLLNVKDYQSVIDLFYNTLLLTNRSFDFFTNWEKIKEKYQKYRIELNILSSLINDNDFDNTLRKILKDYPKVIPVIPLLVALRKSKLSIIDNFHSESIKNFNYDFSARRLSNEELEDFADFFAKTGLKKFFLKLSQKSIPDYYLGVEVGLDTHARKNRSGKIMEDYIHRKILQINTKLKNSFGIFTQKKYKFLKEKYGYGITSGLANRKADFLLIRNDMKIIAIETNFYSETGSKPQEIVNSYIQRQNELKKFDIDFIWITDGIAWKKQRNQMNFAFEKLDYISNISFIKMGLLEQIITSV